MSDGAPHVVGVGNKNLHAAKKAKNDEFYTMPEYIAAEMNAYLERDPNLFAGKTVLLPCDDPEKSNFTKYFVSNFTDLGLEKLVSTCHKAEARGKILTLEKSSSPKISYLAGDGDFRSPEVTELRNSADMVITNPPFSLLREFIAWLMDGDIKFSIIGNMNAITYKEIFPLIKQNRLWKGATGNNKDMVFQVPKGAEVKLEYERKAAQLGYPSGSGKQFTVIGNSCWLTNIEHGGRHQPLQLRTMAENLAQSRHKKIREQGYPRYDNLDGIEVSFTDAIPADYKGLMGVPISFLDKYDPGQFQIVGFRKGADGKDLTYTHNDKKIYPYFRIIIRALGGGMAGVHTATGA